MILIAWPIAESFNSFHRAKNVILGNGNDWLAPFFNEGTYAYIGSPLESGTQSFYRKLKAIWDTGAMGTSVSKKLAIELNLYKIWEIEVLALQEVLFAQNIL